jgi:hypothetical protein
MMRRQDTAAEADADLRYRVVLQLVEVFGKRSSTGPSANIKDMLAFYWVNIS